MTRAKKYLILATTALTTLAWFGPATAQSSRYQSWSDPNKPEPAKQSAPARSGETEKLIRELRTLIREAEQARAANPVFLKDLKETLARYDNPFPSTLLQDDFSDGNLNRNPRWRILQGQFRVSRYGGMSSRVALPGQLQPTRSGQSSQSSRKRSGEEEVINLFGQILLGGNKNKQQQQQQQQSGTSQNNDTGMDRDPAIALVEAHFSNAFQLEMQWESQPDRGTALELGVFQGRDARPGYRILLNGNGRARLIRVGRQVVTLAENRYRFPDLVDGWRNPGYRIQWTRTPQGRMVVKMAGKVLFDVTDNGFRDKFLGFRLANVAGEHTLKSIRVLGRKP